MKPRTTWLKPVAAMLAILPAFVADAHPMSMSRLSLTFEGTEALSSWSITRQDLEHVGTPKDADRDGHLTMNDFLVQGKAFQDFFAMHVRMFEEGEACDYEPVGVALPVADTLRVDGRFVCPRIPGPLEIQCDFDRSISGMHRMVASLTVNGGEGPRQWHTFQEGSSTWRVDLGGGSGMSGQWLRFFLMGVEHIFTGYDHLAFILGLLLLGGGFKRIALVVTSFTLAHSITLAMATLGLVSIPPKVVEPVIAATIAYIGIENLFLRGSGHRWFLAFMFGLVHGFGFAGALLELDMPRSALAVALLGFNLGVEAGQVTVVAILLSFAWFLHLAPGKLSPGRWYRPWGLRLASMGVALAGLVWLVQRL